MNPAPLDIFTAKFRLGKCTDIRPCVVLYPPKDGCVEVAAITTQRELCESDPHFAIETSHPDFPATGLKRNSYVLQHKIAILPIAQLRKHLGRFECDYAREFKDWYGL